MFSVINCTSSAISEDMSANWENAKLRSMYDIALEMGPNVRQSSHSATRVHL